VIIARFTPGQAPSGPRKDIGPPTPQSPLRSPGGAKFGYPGDSSLIRYDLNIIWFHGSIPRYPGIPRSG